MWPFVEELNDWFAEIKENKAKPGDDREQAPMVKNEDPRMAKMAALRAG